MGTWYNLTSITCNHPWRRHNNNLPASLVHMLVEEAGEHSDDAVVAKLNNEQVSCDQV